MENITTQQNPSNPPEKTIVVPVILDGICYGKYEITPKKEIPSLKRRVDYYLSRGTII